MDTELSTNTQVTLLLCGTLGGSRGSVRPLSARQYNRLRTWLAQQNLSLDCLLELGIIETLGISADKDPKLDPLRLERLLARGAALALSVTSWVQQGIWLIDCWDSDYSPNLLDHLGDNAPPLLWGLGDKELLSIGGLAVVGSRNADEASLDFAQRVAEVCAEEDIAIVSGGARGIDGMAMRSALEAGGTVVGILPNGLTRMPVGELFEALEGGRLLLLSQYDPKAPFTVGNAMGRNRCIYAFADWSLVSCSAQGSGGTWAGATEDLKQRHSPLFVSDGEDITEGNSALLRQGGIAFPTDLLGGDQRPESLFEWLDGQSADWHKLKEPEPEPEPPEPEQLSMFQQGD